MKVLFVDIDGVLNSFKYDCERGPDGVFKFIDESRLPLLRRVVDETGARLVLSSTWREDWEPDIKDCGRDGIYITEVFAKYGMTIFDKTVLTNSYYDRPGEIAEWLSRHPETQNYAIVDDDIFGWGELKPHVVITNPRIGYGLEARHADRLIEILNGKI